MEPLRALLSPLLSKTRPMDNMALSWDIPAVRAMGTMRAMRAMRAMHANNKRDQGCC